MSFKVWSDDVWSGEIHAIIITWFLVLPPINESLSTIVSFDCLKGTCFLPESIALIHSLSARRDVFISAPSILLCFILLWESCAFSDPARSTNNNFPESAIIWLFLIYLLYANCSYCMRSTWCIVACSRFSLSFT